MEVVREKSLSPELRQKNSERSDLRGQRVRGWEGGGNLERSDVRGERSGDWGGGGTLERLGGRQLSESGAELPKRFILTKDQKAGAGGEVIDSSSSHMGSFPQDGENEQNLS